MFSTKLALVCGFFILTATGAASAAPRLVDLSVDAVPTLSGVVEEGQFGYAVAAGDIDGDGSIELIVGAPGMPGENGVLHTGACYVFDDLTLDGITRRMPPSGDACGVPAGEIAAALVPGLTERGRFAESLAVADFDGDGLDDIAVGAPSTDHEMSAECGAVAVFFGSPDRPVHALSETAPDLVLAGSTGGARLGEKLASGDLDGDGADELLCAAPGLGGVGSTGPGTVFVFRGATLRGAAAETGPHIADFTADWTIFGEQPGGALSAMAAGDTDGDGKVNLLLGAPQADGADASLIDAGSVYVLPASRIAFGGGVSTLPEPETAVMNGTTHWGFLGATIAVGDVDQDGSDDILVSEYGSSNGTDRVEATGEAFLIFGGPATERGPISLADPSVLRFTAGSMWDMFGLPVLLSDMNGDGFEDMFIASQFADGPDGKRNACGEVYLYRGSLASVMAAKAGGPDLADAIIAGPRAEDAIGGCLLAVDLTGRGRPQLLIGAPDAAGGGEDQSNRQGLLFIVPNDVLER